MDAMKDFLSEEESDCVFRGADTGNNGYLHFTDFIAATLEASGPPVGQREYVEEVFDRMDVQRCGAITQESLMSLMGSSLSPKDALNMLSEEGHKSVDFQTFRLLLANVGDSLNNSVRSSSLNDGLHDNFES